jgi:hypothetical protein
MNESELIEQLKLKQERKELLHWFGQNSYGQNPQAYSQKQRSWNRLKRKLNA